MNARWIVIAVDIGPIAVFLKFNECLRWRLKAIDHFAQKSLNLIGYPGKSGIVDGLHGRHRIDRRNLNMAVFDFLDEHVAWQHGTDFAFRL
jgi:hypothetical protein